MICLQLDHSYNFKVFFLTFCHKNSVTGVFACCTYSNTQVYILLLGIRVCVWGNNIEASHSRNSYSRGTLWVLQELK